MVVFVITQQLPPVLVVALGIVIYLTVLELWNEDDLEFLWKAFWVLFVFLGHIFGYAIFKAWLALRGPPARTGRPCAPIDTPPRAVQPRHLERKLERKQVLAA